METAAINQSLTKLRGMLVLAHLAVWSALVTSLTRGSPRPLDLIQTLSVLAIALSAYSWVLYPTAASILVSVVVLLGLAWAWGVGGSGILGVDLLVCIILLPVSAWQRRARSRRLVRMQQVSGDVQEERTVKDQAIAVTAHTREAMQKKFSRYAQLQSIAEELSNLTDLVSIAQLAVDRAFGLIGKSDVCLLFLIDKEQQELSLFASKRREMIPSIRAKHGDQFDRYVLRTHRPLLVNDIRRDFRFTVPASSERAVSSVIACPLLLGQSPEGVLRLDSQQPGVYNQDDLRFLDILLDLVATAVTNAKLFARTQQLAMTDGLTGLTLRRPFLEQLTRELTRSSRTHEPASVLMLDVDHFKTYNDTFGHTAGDLILKSIAEVLRTVVPPEGVIARYGGEEFAVLLPRLPRHLASDVAEKIRRLVEQQVQGSARREHQAVTPPPLTDARQRWASADSVGRPPLRDAQRNVVRGGGVTISAGVASFPDDAQAELELIRAADQRLYQAKRAGRNLVCSS